MLIIGIDPGKTGAIAVIGQGLKDTPVVFYDMPIVDDDYNEDELSDMLVDYAEGEHHVFVEKVHAMPGQGSVSMFNFGKGFGIIRGVLAALGLRRTFVTPQAWKKELMPGIKDKDAARSRAIQLFPKYSSSLSLKMHIGRADALLIAEYGRRMLDRGGDKSGNSKRKKAKTS